MPQDVSSGQFDKDNIGTEVAEKARSERTGYPVREINDNQTFERSGQLTRPFN